MAMWLCGYVDKWLSGPPTPQHTGWLLVASSLLVRGWLLVGRWFGLRQVSDQFPMRFPTWFPTRWLGVSGLGGRGFQTRWVGVSGLGCRGFPDWVALVSDLGAWKFLTGLATLYGRYWMVMGGKGYVHGQMNKTLRWRLNWPQTEKLRASHQNCRF